MPSAGRRARTRPAPAPPQDRSRAGCCSDSTHPGATSTPALGMDPAEPCPTQVAGDRCPVGAHPGLRAAMEGQRAAPPTHREDAVSPPQLPAEVSRASGQDEGHEDPLAIFPSDNVEAQAGGAFVQDDFPGLPGRTDTGQGDIRVRSSKAGDRKGHAWASWHTGRAGVTPSATWRDSALSTKEADKP